MRWILWAAALGLLPIRAPATEFFVSTSGSDANPGTAAAPFATIQRGVEAVVAGDTVTVLPGVYTYAGPQDGMAVNVDKAGSAPGGLITIAAQSPGGAVLDGGALAHSYFNLTSTAAFVAIRGFEIRNTRWSGVWSNGTAADSIWITGNTIHAIGNRVETSTFGIAGIFTDAAASRWTIDGNTLYAIGRTSGALSGALDHGLYVSGSSFTVINNVGYQLMNGWHIQTAAGFSGRIANNSFFGPDPIGDQPGQIMLWQQSSDLEIKNNLFDGPRSDAINTLDASVSGFCQIENNLAFSSTASVGLIASPPSGCVQSGNLLNVDPQVVSAPAPQFAASSPAKDAGLTLGYVPTDFFGTPRPQGPAYDIGAYEALASIATTTIFTTQVPGRQSSASSPIEVGVKFRSDVAGKALGVRFYKFSSANSGAHLGDLWSRTGQLLASAVFAGESASGWQTVLFSTPVVLAASTTYVASYHTTTKYSITRNYFTGGGVYHPPLRALQSGVDGVDGVYSYGSGATFPVNGVSDSNWWADVLFAYSTAAASNPIPSVAALSPSSAAAGGNAFALQVSGAGFVSTSTVLWNGSGRPTVFINGGTLSAQIGSGDIASSGTAPVQVFNAPPGGGLSNAAAFTILPSSPTSFSISPSSAPAGGEGFALRVFGAGFASGSIVSWNGASRPTTVQSSTAIVAQIYSGDILSTGTAVLGVSGPGGGPAGTFAIVAPSTVPWIAAFYPGYETSTLPLQSVDFTAFDTLIHFAAEPNSDGTLNTTSDSLTPANVAAVVSAAHGAGRRALYTIGGAATQSAFEGAMGSANVANFVSNLVGFMSSNGYDGIDVDMEPIGSADVSPYTAFIQRLRAAMAAARPGTILTANSVWQPQMFAQLSGLFDRLNLLDYNLAGVFTGVTWHNSALYSGGTNLPSTDSYVRQFESAGVPAARLAIGVTADPFIWTGGSGVTGPDQTWTIAPTATGTNYNVVASSFGLVEGRVDNPLYRWDAAAHAPYLSVATSPPSSDAFVSYDDVFEIRDKLFYVSTQALGGAFLWNLADAWRADQPPGSQDLFLQALKVAAYAPLPPDPAPSLATLSPAAVQAGSSSFTLTAAGSNFGAASAVVWNGSPRPTTFVSTGSLTAQIFSSDAASSGTAQVAVFSPAPGGGMTAAKTFFVTSTGPTIASLSPSSAPAGSPGFPMQVQGFGFISSSTVLWNGGALPTTFSSATLLTAQVPGADLAAPQISSVAVFNPDGTGRSDVATFVVYSTGVAASTAAIFTTQVPGYESAASNPIEVGVKFQSDVAGTALGVRFYKFSSANSGIHLGDLWSRTGQLLASAVFSGESASGWQTVLFSTPVVLAASTTYVASYHTTTQYSVTRNYFTSGGVYDPPLRALQSGADGVNGVYSYGSGATFPVNGVSDSNWWADVLFAYSPSSATATAASVSSLAPTAAPAPSAADPTFAFRDLYAFPNPARRGQRMTIRLQAGLADAVDVRIYDLSGHLVHGGSVAAPTILDDGNGKGPQYTYDYPWDVSGVGSGVYVFSVTAHKSGQGTIGKSGKGAVIK